MSFDESREEVVRVTTLPSSLLSLLFRVTFCSSFDADFSTTLPITFPAIRPIINKITAAIIFGADSATPVTNAVNASIPGSYRNSTELSWAYAVCPRIASAERSMSNPDNSSIEDNAIAPIGNVIFLLTGGDHSVLFINRIGSCHWWQNPHVFLYHQKQKGQLVSDKIIRAKDVMHRDIISVDIQTLVKDAAKKMTDLDGDSIIVVDNNIPVGIVTYKDLVKKNIAITNSTDIPIRKIMSSPLIHAGPDQSIWEIMDLIYARNIRRIPIIDEYDTLLGMVNLMSINKALSLARN